MANNLVTMQKIRTLVLQLQQGFSQRRIAQELDLSRNTVQQYVERLQACCSSLNELLGLDDHALAAIVYGHAKQVQPDSRLDDFLSRMPYFMTELRRTGVTRQLLWEEYRAEVPDGYGYTQFCERFTRQIKVEDASMHFEHPAGEVMMVDFAGDKLSYIDKESGELVDCDVFVSVLPFSGYSYVVALADATQPSVIKALNECLAYYGGAPRSLKCDNMRQAVQKSCRYEPIFTETLQQWALHNQISLLAARPRKPKDKAPVESQVKFTYQRIYAPLRNIPSFSLQELNSNIQQALSAYHLRPFQKKDSCRKECFEQQEKVLLQPLADSAYCIKHRALAKVQKNYHITLGEDWHHYSVPYSFIGKETQIIYDGDWVEIYHQHTRIALHRRSYKKHGYSTQKEHMPERHRIYMEQRSWDPDHFLEQASKIGPHTHLYIKGVLQGRHFTEQAYNGCLGILRLAKAYSSDRLEAACKRALHGAQFNYRTLHNILSAGLDTLDEKPEPDPFHLPEHQNLRGPQSYL
jgi:transposase